MILGRVNLVYLSALLTCLIPASELPAQTQEVDYRLGTESIRYLLKKQGFTQLNHLSDLAHPKGKVLVILGDPKPLDRIPNGIVNFMRGGGAILLATDYPVHQGPLLNELYVQVSGEMAKCLDRSPDATYHGLEDCPIVQASPQDITGLVKELRLGLATNKPSYLRFNPPRLHWPLKEIGTLPPDCISEDGRPIRVNDNKPPVFGLAGSFLTGRILILADHSVFINQMMQQVDDGNAEFARRCIKWLQGEKGERTEVLFYDNGQIKTLDIELKRLPAPPPDRKMDLAQAFNQLLSGAEDENIFDLILQNLMPRDWNPAAFRLILFSVVFLVLTFVAISMTRYRRLPGVPLLSKAVTQTSPSLTVVDQRNDALIKSGNWGEAAQGLGWHFFDDAGIHGDTLPPSRVNGGPFKNWQARRRLRQVWNLTHATSPPPISPRAYQELQRLIQRMKADLAHGDLTFLSVNSPGDGKQGVS